MRNAAGGRLSSKRIHEESKKSGQVSERDDMELMTCSGERCSGETAWNPAIDNYGECV